MSLRNLQNPTPTRMVQVSNDEGFAVRGLSPRDVLAIYNRHGGEMSNMFERLVAEYQTNGNQVNPADVQAVAFTMLNDAPRLLAEAIALAAGGSVEDELAWQEEVAIAESLSFPVQADALGKIAELTFTSEMPVGKFMSLVVGALKKATTYLPR